MTAGAETEDNRVPTLPSLPAAAPRGAPASSALDGVFLLTAYGRWSICGVLAAGTLYGPEGGFRRLFLLKRLSDRRGVFSRAAAGT
jgi:hypothetical protein